MPWTEAVRQGFLQLGSCAVWPLWGLTRSRRSKCFARLVSGRWNRSVSVKGAWLLARGASGCAFVCAGELRRKKVRVRGSSWLLPGAYST